jgi:acyl-CoA thioester hydrolase
MAVPRIPVFRRERTVEARHVDELGHVNNLAWVRFSLELAEAHAAALGQGYAALRARGLVWVVHHQDLHYRRSAFPGQALQESTWLSELRGARCRRHARMHDAAGQLLFSADTDWALVDFAKLRPRRIPPDVIAAFDLVAADPV